MFGPANNVLIRDMSLKFILCWVWHFSESTFRGSTVYPMIIAGYMVVMSTGLPTGIHFCHHFTLPWVITHPKKPEGVVMNTLNFG